MKIYIVYGLIICTLFAAAGTKGFVVASLMQPGRWGGGLFGQSQYHK
jgi:hypothetical protein